MEDLKKMQEFFSKPLEEGEQLDIIDLAKVVQAVTKTGHPVTVLLTPKFNEIEVLTGMNAPDDMLRDLSIAVDSLGYGRNDIIIAADSSNLSRREYSDIRRVNGGHKDYFEESLNEDKEKAINYLQQAIKLSHTNKVRNLILKAVRELGLEVPKVWTESLNENEDPIIVKYFKRGDNHFQILVKYERPVGFTTALGSRTALGSQIDQNEAAAQERVKTIVNKLKAEFNLDNIEVNKGQVAGRYYIDAFSDNFREMDVNDLEGSYALNEEKKLTYNDFVRMVRDDMMAGSAPDEKPSEELVKKRAKSLYNDYLKGASVDDLFEYNTGIYYDPTKSSPRPKAKEASKSGLEKVRDFVKKVMKEEEITVDDATEFKLNLKHLLDKHVVEATKEEETEFHTKLDKLVHDTFGKRKDELEESASTEEKRIAMSAIKRIAKYRGVSEDEARNDLIRAAKEIGNLKEDLSDYEEKDADYDKLYSDYLYKMVKEVAAEKGYSKFLVSKDNPKGETDGLTTATMNKILMNIIKDIDETIQLGKNLEEGKLCKAGEAYRKRRMAAGEKSSAYLSGRAVKVCKGQMSGKKKKKKK